MQKNMQKHFQSCAKSCVLTQKYLHSLKNLHELRYQRHRHTKLAMTSIKTKQVNVPKCTKMLEAKVDQII